MLYHAQKIYNNVNVYNICGKCYNYRYNNIIDVPTPIIKLRLAVWEAFW